MADLYLAMAVTCVGALIVLCVVAHLSRKWTGWVVGAVGILAVVVLLAHGAWLVDNLVWARWLPVRGVMIWGNVTPWAAGALAGLAWGRGPRARWRRGLAAIAILGVAGAKVYGPVFGGVPDLGVPRWKGEVCRQTSQASCSAAAAATLLRAHGIDASEAEMADLCLTRPAGTTMLGLYRGLKIKTAGTGWRVMAFTGSYAAFRDAGPRPAIISVGLRRGATADVRYERDWGWAPGVKHSVVWFGAVDGGKVDIGDPSVGREQWLERGVKDLWFGEAMYLVKD